MYILVGASWLFYWALVDVFDIESLKASLVTGVVFVLVGLILGGVPNFSRDK